MSDSTYFEIPHTEPRAVATGYYAQLKPGSVFVDVVSFALKVSRWYGSGGKAEPNMAHNF
jgi:hypothetical protein